jgi:hypothetical protein
MRIRSIFRIAVYETAAVLAPYFKVAVHEALVKCWLAPKFYFSHSIVSSFIVTPLLVPYYFSFYIVQLFAIGALLHPTKEQQRPNGKQYS